MISDLKELSRGERGSLFPNGDHWGTIDRGARPSTVELNWYLRRQCGVSVRRRDLPYPDLIAVRDLWVTDVPLTVLEVAVAQGPAGSVIDVAFPQ